MRGGGLIKIGISGWSIAPEERERLPLDGSHLERYAGIFNATEINSSFYRPHRLSTYQRWARSVPRHFKFSVKMPKSISHESGLVGARRELASFLDAAQGLGAHLGAILLQLPPSLSFSPVKVAKFLARMRRAVQTPIVCEPRHASWFTQRAQQLLQEFGVDRAGVDPARTPAAAAPAAAGEVHYYRLHGSPRVYYSAYPEPFLRELAGQLRAAREAGKDCWCIFDNTAQGAAWGNALKLRTLLRRG